jgi:tetratricopeptide (TPR) repeat protein
LVPVSRGERETGNTNPVADRARTNSMNRIATPAVLAGCTLLAVSLAARADHTADWITYFDRGEKVEKTIKTKFTITAETPVKILFLEGAKTVEVLAGDVRHLEYVLGAGTQPTYRKAIDQEKEMLKPDAKDPKKAFETSLESYQKSLADIKGQSLPHASRHIEFCIGRLLARRADADPAQADPALQALTKVIKDHPDSWQILEAARLLGQVQGSAAKKADVQKAYEELAARIDLPKEARQEFEFLLVRSLIQGGGHAQAKERLTKMALAPTDPQAPKAQVYLAEAHIAGRNFDEAKKVLRAVLDGKADYATKGMAANALGDCYRLSGRDEDKKEALWQYLWVDQVYNHDRHEHARALYHLSKLFGEIGGENAGARKEEFRAKLLENPEFRGLEYRRKADGEEAVKPMK